MGYIKEPAGIDFVVEPSTVTIADRKKISEIIAHYKATGKKMSIKKPIRKPRSSHTIKQKLLS